MEGVGELIKVESKTVSELEGELANAYKTIAEKEAVIKRLLENNAVLEMRLQSKGDTDVRELEVKPSPVERKAEQIIPKECWGLVFKNLKAEDLLSCRQVCKTFKGVLDAKEFKEKWQFHLVFPLLFPHLKTRHLYNARLVCRSWRHSIGKFASDVHGKQRRQSFFPRMSEMPLVTGFRTSEDIGEFLEKFGECSTNPFPSRSVYMGTPSDPVENDDYAEQKAYIRKAGKLFKQFGKHIFRLRLCLQYERISGLDPSNLCKLIRSITIRLPNLKELLIRNGYIDPDEDDEDRVATYIEENALAALPKLRALSIDAFQLDKMEDYLLDAFGPQLTELEMLYADNPKLSQFRMQQLKNVRKLWLAVDGHDSLDSLRFLQSPLELLKLTCENLETWNMDRLLSSLRHLPIELLEIQLWDMRRLNLTEAGMDIEEYNNANIKTLIIHIDKPTADSHQISINFLQALTKLENLEFKFPGQAGKQLLITHPGELPEVVKLNGYLFGGKGSDLPYHSNVWEKVPTLKTLTLTGREDGFAKSIFTREKYERFIKDSEDCPERN